MRVSSELMSMITAAAAAAGAQLVVIRRPPEQGETASEVLKRCKEMIR